MGASADEVLLKIKAEGWKAAAAQVKATEKAIRDAKKAADKKPPGGGRGSWLGQLGLTLRGLPASWRAGEAGATQFRRTISGVGGDIARLSRGVAGTAASIAGLGGLATVGGGGALLGGFVKSGLELNASFEDARVSFGTLLGDMERGNAFIERLRTDISSKSPQRLTTVMGGGQTLLGQGMNEDQAIATLGALDKAVIALGKGEEEYKLGARALGQMWANGKASLEDVNQLAEGAGINVRKLLQEKLGLSGTEVADLGNQDVSSAAALWAITSGWEEQFSSAAKNAEATWSVQVKQMVKDWEFFKRMTTEGLFKDLSKDVLPEIRKAQRNVNDIMAREDLTFGQKLRLSWKSAKTDLGPLAEDLRQGIADLELDDRLKDAFSEHGPDVAAFVAETAAKGVEKGVPAAASAFWDAFKEMGTGGKLLTGTALMAWLRFPFWTAGFGGAKILAKGIRWGGGRALGPVGAKLGGTVVGKAAEEIALRSMILGDTIKAKAAPGMGIAGGALGAMLGAALAAKTLDEITKRITGDSLSERLREGITGRDKDGRRTMPGTGGFTASPGVRTGDRTRLEELEAWFRGAERRSDGTLVGSRRIAGMPGVTTRRLTSKDREELESLRKRLRPRATGGTVRPGEFTIVGERGPELARFPSGTDIVSNRQARTMGAGRRDQVRREVVNRQPVNLFLDRRVLAQAIAEETEIVELRR